MGGSSKSKNETTNLTQSVNAANADNPIVNLGNGDVTKTDFGAVEKALGFGDHSLEFAEEAGKNSLDLVSDSTEEFTKFGRGLSENLQSVAADAIKNSEDSLETSLDYSRDTNDGAFDLIGNVINQSIGAVSDSLKTSYEGLANNTRAIAQSSQSEASQQTGTLINAVKYVAIAGAVAYALKGSK